MKNLWKIFSRYPLLLLAIPLVFIVHSATHYFALLAWREIIPSFLLCVVGGIMLYGIFYLIFRSATKASLFTGWLLLVFYFFSALHEWLRIAIPSLSRYTILLIVLGIALIVLFIYLKKSKKNFENGLARFNIIILVLLIVGATQFFYKLATHAEKLNEQGRLDKPISSHYQVCKDCIKPDIYYILLDGYTNSQTLLKEFNYNNSEIEQFLMGRSFHIIRNSRSNYNFTHMSLASIFDMDYLNNLDNSKTFHTKEFLQSYQTIYYNEWVKILEKEGYRMSNYSIFNMENSNTLTLPFLSELSYRSVLGETFFNKVRRDIGWQWRKYFPKKALSVDELAYVENNVHRISQAYNGVLEEALTYDSTPKFVYAHFLLPHETFYFDSTGKRLSPEFTMSKRTNREDYVNQLVYTNKYIIEPLVNKVFANKKRPTIFIIQGDHGYRNYPKEKTNLEFENFNAVFFPDSNYQAFNKTHSSVNTFRIVLNNYFYQNLPLLKDSSINLLKERTQ